MARPTPTPFRRPPPRQSILLRAAVFTSLALFMFMTACGWDIGEHISNWRFALGLGGEGQTAEEALRQSDAALRWDPDNAQILLSQIALYRRQGDLETALAKTQQLIDATPTFSEEHFTALNQRADLLQVLGRHQEAIAEADKMVALAEQASSRLASRGSAESMLHSMRNTRAYFIARAAADQKAAPEEKPTAKQKGEAQEEMLTVLREMRAAYRGGSQNLSAKMLHWESELSYLDTLAYLRLYSGNPMALRDLNRCVDQCEYLVQLWQSVAADRIEFAALANMGQRLEHSYAAILHHRGEALALAKNYEAAQRDKKLAEQFGYNPKLGNW